MSGIHITIEDKFWLRYRNLVRDVMIPYQWKVLNDDIHITIERERDDASIPNEKSHAIENFKIAAGRTGGRHYGWVFQDSDVYKWLEAVAYSLREKTDENLKGLADSVVDLISEAQEEDGYLDTYFTIEAPERKYKQLSESHELYCAGHFMEAAVAYHEATGNQKVLRTACKLADHIDSVFGKEDGKIHGYDGHEEIEIGLMRLYRLTKNTRYLELARFFLNVRGKDGGFFAKQRAEERNKASLVQGMEHRPLQYYQAHCPVEEQKTAEGHAVRLVYLCTAMADVAAETGNERLLDACRRIWRNIIDKRMYITGGIGSTVSGEAFTLDYDLPNDTMYCETCASVGLVFFAYQMLRLEDRGEYADVMECALYNTILGGISLDGTHFFYVNPLEAVPEKSHKDPGKSHVKCVRPEWLGCACCPPNAARLLASLDQYVYMQKDNKLLINLFMESRAEIPMGDGILEIEQITDYPWQGTVTFKLNSGSSSPVTLGIRIPDWSDTFAVDINGTFASLLPEDGYIYIEKVFKNDTVRLVLDMKVKRWYSNPYVESDIGKVALSRGPFVYCMEGADNGEDLHLISLNQNEAIQYEFDETLLEGVGVLTAAGQVTVPKSAELYQKNQLSAEKKVKKIKWIPYYSWANRGENEMRVWIRE